MNASERFSTLPRLPRDEDGPVFAEPWQAQAFALAVKLSEQGHFTWTEWAAALADEVKAAAALGLPDGEGAVGVFVYTHLFILTRYMVFGDSGLFLECLDGPTAIPYWEFDERTFAMTPDGKLDLGFGEVPALDGSGFDVALLLDILVSLKKAFKKSGWASQKPSGL